MKKTVRIIFALALVAAMTLLGVIAVGAEGSGTSLHVHKTHGGIVDYDGDGSLDGRAERDAKLPNSTCTKSAGTVTQNHCLECDKWFASAGSGNSHSFDEGVTVESCDGKNYTKKTCSVCGYVEMTEAEGTNEKSGEHEFEEVSTPASCTTDGSRSLVCKKCGYVKESVVEGAIGHYADKKRFVRWENGISPTCQQAATAVYRCITCGAEVSVYFGMGQHYYVVEENKPATCTETGYKKEVCSVCGDVKETFYGVSSFHTWGVWTTTKAATCTDEGEQTRTCTVCGATEKKTLPNLGGEHKFAALIENVAATCNTPGKQVRRCRICNAETTIVVPATGKHVYTDDNDCTTPATCSVCGTVVVPAISHVLEYKSVGNRMHVITCKNEGCQFTERENCSGTDDGNCTTAIVCDKCGSTVKIGLASHDYEDKYIPSATDPSKGHVRQCVNDGCAITNATVQAHDQNGAGGACSKCGYKDAGVHEHKYEWKHDKSEHWQECSICGARTEESAHNAPSEYAGDCGVAVKCSVCGYEVLPALTGHSYSATSWEIDADHHYQTCTQPGCKARNEYPHNVFDDHDCMTPNKCSVCGYEAVAAGTAHSWVLVEGSGTEKGHLRSCSNPGCDVDNVFAEHVMGQPATCVSGAECEFCHTHYGAVDPEKHVGGTEIKNAKPATTESEGYTGDEYCFGCGAKIAEGTVIEKLPEDHVHVFNTYKPTEGGHRAYCSCGAFDESSEVEEHTFGAFTDNGDGTHSRTCSVCGAVDSEPHEHEPENYDCTKPLLCVDCKAVVVEAHETHTFTGRAEGTKDGHTLACVCVSRNCKVTSELAPHTGGSASCTSGAHCEVCGFEYTAKDATRHDGGTELRGHKNATETEKGYTGDTYCLGCGEIIAKGTDIDMLPSTHEHAFGEWMADGTHHWRECACGDWSGYAAHTYENGACTVCGALDPDYVHVDVLVDEESGTTATPEENAEYYAGIELNVDVVDETMTKEHAEVEATVGKKFEVYKALDITLVDKATGKTVQANGKLTVKVAVPAGWRADATAVYYVHDGVMEKMASTVTEGGAYVTFVTDHLSIYVLVNTSTEVEPEKTPDETTKAPDETTATPADTTATPADTTATPVETSATPADTTASPAETTAKPAETTGAPGSTEPPPTGETFNVTAVCVMLIVASVCGVCATVGAKRGRKN